MMGTAGTEEPGSVGSTGSDASVTCTLTVLRSCLFNIFMDDLDESVVAKKKFF